MKRQKSQTKIPILVCIYFFRLPIQITIPQHDIFLTAHITYLLGVSKNKVIPRLDALFVQYVFI